MAAVTPRENALYKFYILNFITAMIFHLLKILTNSTEEAVWLLQSVECKRQLELPRAQIARARAGVLMPSRK